MDFVLNKFITPYLDKIPVILSPVGTILAMYIIVYLSKLQHAMYSILLMQKYDIVNASYRNSNSSKKTFSEKVVARAYNAHANNWEALLGFAIPVILILQQKISSNEINQLCNLFIAVRVAYTVLYPLAFSVPISLVRSSVFTIGIAIILKLFSIAIPSMLFVADFKSVIDEQ
jgi:uncharacterized MAPEG superfamily protein